jgi:3-dehydroquinate dehydratase
VTRPGNRARLTADAICGLGPYGYIAAMDAVAQMAKKG